MTNSSANNITYTQKALLLGALLLLVCLGSILAIFMEKSNTSNAVAHIYQNGKLLQSIPLYTVTKDYSFSITGDNGAVNTIQVYPGSIGIISASCPDKLCVHQGFISDSKLPITCLPNRLVIQLRSADNGLQTDTVTY